MAVSSMKEGVDRVAVGVSQAEEAGTSILQVQNRSQLVLASIEDISNSLREQTSASAEIARQVEQIAQVAEENTQVARINAVTANNLRQLAQRLESGIQPFKT